jgi:transcriptional regulator with XRE-family HTH domain
LPLKPPPPGIQALRYHRMAKLISQQELGLKIGEDQSTVSRLETGMLVPTAEQLAKLCKALKLKPAELFTRPILEECARRAKVAVGK